ncbi:MAG: photosynthetic complex assembly protein PuhC [Paracoccaceae bacterium]
MTQMTNQMRDRDREMVPRILVQAMFALMATSLVLVGLAVWTDRDHVGTRSPAEIVSSVTYVLDGTRDGTVSVVAEDGTVVANSNSDMNGFIGVIWRVLARERMLQNAPENDPIQVVRRLNGQIAILDPATDTAIELVGYGPDNVAAFAKLVP